MKTRLTLETAGESHGAALVGILSGLPAGIPVAPERIAAALAARRAAPGRSVRQAVEDDAFELLSGVAAGKTSGAPVAILLPNGVRDAHPSMARAVPRPGHADLPGMLKYGARSVGEVAERASARRTALDCAFGALLETFLERLGIALADRVVALGGKGGGAEWARALEAAGRAGDTLGGVVEISASGLPPGIGSPFEDGLRLDARLAASLLGIPAVRGILFGDAATQAALPGSAAQDALVRGRNGSIRRATNRAGGVEGGMANGETLVAHLFVKPVPSAAGVRSVDLATGRPAPAPSPRHDVSAAPAVAKIARARAAFALSDLLLLAFGGDALAQTARALSAHRRDAARRLRAK